MKTSKRIKDGWMRIAVFADESTAVAGVDSESWNFFELVSSSLIEELNIQISKKNAGPDSSRWIGKLSETQIYFEFDDLIGTTVCVDLQVKESSQIVDNVVNAVKEMNPLTNQ